MPELPEVETIRLQLRQKLSNQTIRAVEVFHSKSVAHDKTIEDRLPGKTVAGVDRIGKLLIISFVKEPDLFLLAHLKMTGQFFFVAKGEVSGGGHSMTDVDVRELPGRHTRVAFYFMSGAILYFNDMRLFGYTKLATAAEVERARASFGPEPIADDFNETWFVDSLRKRKTSVKAALLDQSFVAGLGNIYVDEALWRAMVRPTRKANTLTKAEAARLGRPASAVLRESIAVGGTTFQNFVDTGGNNGNFTDYLKVFGKQGTICTRCGETIKKTRVAGRGTHYCPGCQR